MDRRNFLKLTSAAGLSVVSPVVYGEYGIKEEPRTTAAYEGNLYLFVNAGGGWDPTSFCDPKGAAYEDDPERMNNYLTDDIMQAGNIRYAPVGGNQAFFDKYYDRLLVINGIDMQTNGHDAGSRHWSSGRLTEGYPSQAAFLAGAFDPKLPLSFLAFGGYTETQGLVARTRSGNINVLQRLAFPSRMNPDDEQSSFHNPIAEEAIERAMKDREIALLERQGLPKIRQAMSTLFTSRSGSNELRRLTEFLPETFSDNRIGEQGQLALAAYRAGVCVSANLSIGGFDTHGNHDANHIPRLQELFEGVDIIMEEAAAAGIADRVFIAMGSDFGRSPGYNDGNGKDHHTISSMMFMGPNIPGNRVIGETTYRHQAIGMNLDTLQIDDRPDAPHIHPGHVANAIRKLAGIESTELSAMFPLADTPDIGLFDA